MPHPLLIFSQSDYLIWIFAINSHNGNSADPGQLASSDLDLHCLQQQGISGLSITRDNNYCGSVTTVLTTISQLVWMVSCLHVPMISLLLLWMNVSGHGLMTIWLIDCVEVLRPSQPSRVMLSAVSLPNHTFTGQA